MIIIISIIILIINTIMIMTIMIMMIIIIIFNLRWGFGPPAEAFSFLSMNFN